MEKLRIFHTIMACKGFYKPHQNHILELPRGMTIFDMEKILKDYKRNHKYTMSIQKTLRADGYMVTTVQDMNNVLLSQLSRTEKPIWKHPELLYQNLYPYQTFKYNYHHKYSMFNTEGYTMDFNMDYAIFYLCISELKQLSNFEFIEGKLDFKNVLPRKNGIKDSMLIKYGLI